jgi:hypothetical protein
MIKFLQISLVKNPHYGHRYSTELYSNTSHSKNTSNNLTIFVTAGLLIPELGNPDELLLKGMPRCSLKRGLLIWIQIQTHIYE